MFTGEGDDQTPCASHRAAAVDVEDVPKTQLRTRRPALAQAEQRVQHGGVASVTAVGALDPVHVHHVARRALQPRSVILAHVALLDCRWVCNIQRIQSLLSEGFVKIKGQL